MFLSGNFELQKIIQNETSLPVIVKILHHYKKYRYLIVAENFKNWYIYQPFQKLP